jgi:transposase InsO family protein
MIDLFLAFLASFRVHFRSWAQTQIEILALRHQIGILQRQCPKPRLRIWDRRFWLFLSRYWSKWESALAILKPSTIVGWHRQGFRWYWTWKTRHGKAGRPAVSKETRDLIRTMSRDNPLWGAPRIHSELLKLGIKVSKASVAKYMVRSSKPPSQRWKTFLRNHISQLASVDFFTVPTATFHVLYVFIVLQHDRRRVVHFNVTNHPTAAWTARQIVEAFPFDCTPKYLVRDRDGIYGTEFRSQLETMSIDEIPTAPRSPWQNPYAERIIGSIRRECLDHVIVMNEESLRRVLCQYFAHYHRSRLHLSLDKDSPDPRPVASKGNVVAIPEVGGMHHRYDRRAA